MPLRTDTNKGGIVPSASSWRAGFRRTGFTLDDYVDLGERADDAGEDADA